MLNFKAAALFTQDCTLCGAISAELVCSECAAALPPSEMQDDAIAVFAYRFPVDRLMQRYKYAGDLAIGRWLAERLLHRVRSEERPDLIVAPPSTIARLRSRGFNPALEIAKTVARGIGVRCEIEALERARETAPQPGLGRRARARNLQGSMRCRLALDGRHVALVDDVITTGATASAAAKALMDRGAARVSAWVVARTPDPHV